MRMRGGAGHQDLHFKRAFGGNYMIDPEDGCQLQKAEAPFLLLASLFLVALGIQ